MLFKSPHAAYVVKVRSALPTYNARGEIIHSRRAVRAEFGSFGPEQAVLNPLTGRTEMFADITGHFFDTDLWYERQIEGVRDPKELEMLAEEKEYMEYVLQREARIKPGQLQQIERRELPVPAPWANYDDQQPGEVVAAAELLGLVPQAVAYERANLKRPDVLGPLETLLDATGAAVPAPELVFEEGALDTPAERTGVVLGQPQDRSPGGIMQNGPNIVLT